MKKKAKSKARKPGAQTVEQARAAAERADNAARASKEAVRSAKSKLKAAKKSLKAAEREAKKLRKEARHARRVLKSLRSRKTAGKKRHGARRGSPAGKPEPVKKVSPRRRPAKTRPAHAVAPPALSQSPAAMPEHPTE